MNKTKELKIFFGMIWKINPAYFFVLFLGALINASQVMLNAYLPKLLIDELLATSDLSLLIIYAGLIIGSNALIILLRNIYVRLADVQHEKMILEIEKKMAEKIINIEYYYLEDPYYLDLKQRALFACNNQGSLYRLVYGFAGIVSDIVTIIGILAIMLTLGWVLVVAVLVVVILNIMARLFIIRKEIKFYDSIIPINRRFEYYADTGMLRSAGRDFRLNNGNEIINSKIYKFNLQSCDSFKGIFMLYGLFEGIMRIINIIQTAFTYGYVALRAITDKFGSKIGLGSFSMYVSTTISFSTTLSSLINRFMEFYQILKYLEPYAEFMSIKELDKKGDEVEFTETFKTIEFKNVCFKYPKTDRLILDNVSFKINKGEKISIVGLNGAGKTTIVKLICRLFAPTSGEILVNGVNIFTYDFRSYNRQLTAVFQDYKLFAYSIKDNIECGVVDHEDKISNILKQIGIYDKVESLALKENSCINKEYDIDGVELSGGQLQKIAIARSLYKEASLVILDEPTSALDPISEAEVYQNFNNLVTDKTAIYISHRMSSSVFCDKVLVIEEGKVVDFDLHENIMKKPDTLYYKLYTSQAKNYSV